MRATGNTAGGANMRDKKRVREVIIVEGKYDKNTVAQAVGATIIETSGFGIFSDKEKLSLLRKLAEKRGLIILTDSDSAGFFIRGRLRGMIGSLNIKHAYIPDIQGREKRKSADSKERLLGVEGMAVDTIITALERAGATFICLGENQVGGDFQPKPQITKADMFELGLSGGPDSSANRRKLIRCLNLPEKLSANGLLDVLNVLFTRDEFLAEFRQY